MNAALCPLKQFVSFASPLHHFGDYPLNVRMFCVSFATQLLRGLCFDFNENNVSARGVLIRAFVLNRSVRGFRFGTHYKPNQHKSCTKFARIVEWSSNICFLCVIFVFILPISLLHFWTLVGLITVMSMEGQRALGIHQKYLDLCSEDEQSSYGFGTTRG